MSTFRQISPKMKSVSLDEPPEVVLAKPVKLDGPRSS